MSILAGVTISTLTGKNSLFQKAEQAKIISEKAQLKEEIELAILEIENIDNITLEKVNKELPTKLNITAQMKDEKIIGKYKGYEYTIDNKFVVTIGNNTDPEDIIQEKLIMSEDLKYWLNETGEKITLEDILKDSTVGEVEGLIPIIQEQDVTRSEESGIIKYKDKTGGTISTNSELERTPVYLAFNGVKDKILGTYSKIGEAENYWLEYDFAQNVKALYAKIKIGTGTNSYGERIMKVQAFNEYEDVWEDLTNEIMYKGTSSEMPEDILRLNSNKLYKKFRIYIPSIVNSTSYGAHHSGVVTFQLYGIKTEDNSILDERVEEKVISTSELNIQLENALNMEKLMQRLMKNKKTDNIMLKNENVRNAVLSSAIALNKTERINNIVTR